MIKKLTLLLNNNKTDIICLCLIFIFSAVALRSLLSVPFYTSHDGFTHTARIAAYYNTLKEGQTPPRWAKNLNGQFGSPIFVYSYPLVYFLGAVLHLGGLSYESAFRFIMSAGYLLAGLGAYLWLRKRFGKPAGFVGAMFYLWVPYHFLNIYVRGALAENMAYGFLPFAFWAIEEIYRSERIRFWSIALIFSVTALLLSHNLVSAISLPILIVWSILQGLKCGNWLRRVSNVLGLIIPFLLSAFIYVPDILERNFIRFDQGISYFANHFVVWWQLLRSPWGYGFDFFDAANDAMSFQLGLAQLLMLVMLVIVLIVKASKDKKILLRKLSWDVIFFIVLFILLLTLVISHPASLILWNNLPMVKTIVDFPWRLLGLITLIMAYFSAFFVAELNSKLIVVLFLTSSVLVANRNFIRVNEAVTFGDAAYDNYTGSSTASSGEYTPIWRSNNNFPLYSKRVDLINPNSIHLQTNRADEMKFSVDPNSGREIRINRFYFPDTQIYYNGEILDQGKDWTIIRGRTTPLSEFDDTGLILLNLNPAGGEYRLIFRETPIRNFADKISLTTFIVMLIFTLSLINVKKK